jgi:hypothetical protein
VHQRHRADALLRLREHLPRLGVLDRAGLQPQEARRDLQVVLDAVVDLAQQRFFSRSDAWISSSARRRSVMSRTMLITSSS